jgi:molybdenum cofactor guanylyltransferase
MERNPGGRAGSGRRPVGAVLAGGRGSRLGGDKHAALLAGRSLLEHALAAVDEAGLDPLVVAKPDTPLPSDCRALREPPRPRHPLSGILAALEVAGSAVVAVACDMPFTPPALLRQLASADEPLVALCVDGTVQPLPARFDPSLVPELEAALVRQEPLRRTIESFGPRLIEESELRRFGDPELICLNVNDRRDLLLAERRLGGSGASPSPSRLR